MLKRKKIDLTFENILVDAELNILRWYDFTDQAKVLSVGWNHSVTERFCREREYLFWNVKPDGLLYEDFSIRHCNEMDYVILMETIEVTESPEELIRKAYECLSENGTMLVIANNRYAIKHFCGEKTPYESKLYHELEGETSEDGSHCWGIGEIEDLFCNAGITKFQKYAVFPSLYHVKKVYSFDYTIKDKANIMLSPWYRDNRLVYAHEEKMYDGLISSGLFYPMANGFFFEIKKSGRGCGILSATVSSCRPAERQFITVIRENRKVEKRPVYENGMVHLKQLEKNHEYLCERGLHLISGRLKNDVYETDFADSPGLLEHMRRAFYNGHGEIITLFDQFVEELKKSSTWEEDAELGEIMEHGFADLVPQNCFYEEGKFLFYDQEYDIPYFPLKVIIFRSLVILYNVYPEFEKGLPFSFFLERYGILENRKKIQQIERDFLVGLNMENIMQLHKDYHNSCEAAIQANSHALNEESLKRQLMDKCQIDMENKKLILFGINSQTKKFIKKYADRSCIEFLIEDDLVQQGKDLEGYPVYAIDKLADLDCSEYQVIIFDKDFLASYQRLYRWGIRNFGVYEIEGNRQ